MSFTVQSPSGRELLGRPPDVSTRASRWLPSARVLLVTVNRPVGPANAVPITLVGPTPATSVTVVPGSAMPLTASTLSFVIRSDGLEPVSSETETSVGRSTAAVSATMNVAFTVIVPSLTVVVNVSVALAAS